MRQAVPRMEGAEATPQSSQHTGQPVTLPGQARSGKHIKQPGPAQVPPPRLRCRTPDHGFTSDSPGSVLKYSFDLIHFFFSKVNDSEMNPPILLDAHLPGKQNTEVWSWVHNDRRSPDTCSVKCKRVPQERATRKAEHGTGHSGWLVSASVFLFLLPRKPWNLNM